MMTATPGYASALGAAPHSTAMFNLLTFNQVVATHGGTEDWIEACKAIGFDEMPPLAGREVPKGLCRVCGPRVDVEQIADGEGLWQDGELPDLIDAADEYLLDHGYDINGNLIDDLDDDEDDDEFDQDLEVQERFELAELKSAEDHLRTIAYNDFGHGEVTCWKAYYRTQYRPSVIAAQSKAQVAKQWSFDVPYGWYGMFDRDEIERPETDGLEDVEAWMAWHEAGLPFDVLFEQEMLEFNEPFVDVSDPDFDHDWDWHYRDRSMAWEDFDEYDDDDDDLDDWDRMDDDWGDPYADGLNDEWSIDDNSWEDNDPYGFWDEEDGWNEYDIRRSWGFGKGSGREQLSLEYFRQKHPRVEDLQEEFELEEIRVRVRESHDSYRLWQEEYGKDNQAWNSWKRYRCAQRWPVVHSVPWGEATRHLAAIPISLEDDFQDLLLEDLMDLEDAA
ncbi:MAG: hypothetical protein ABIH67_04725 [Candidatus Uhrbacteria bacterium]